MAPATKKRKTDNNVKKFLCFSCDTYRLSTQFDDFNPTPDCDHLINHCKRCLKKWVKSNVESATFAVGGEDGKIFGIKCPQCDGIMRSVNVEIATTKKVYERFEELERKHIGNSTPNWRWCLAPGCKAGQVYGAKVHEEEPKPKLRKRPGFFKRAFQRDTVDKDELDICTCHECGAKACVTCDRPWHEGESCTDYQARIKDRVEEENKALKEIQKVTKNCPNPRCGKKIQKNGGCPMMHCTQCKSAFCWNCCQLLQKGYCRCRPPPQAR